MLINWRSDILMDKVYIPGHDKVVYTIKCPVCKQEYKLMFSRDEEQRIFSEMCKDNGLTIQEIMKDWKPYKREFLISGLCKSCQDRFFGGTEDE